MGTIRNIAVGLPVRDGHVLLSEGFDRVRQLRFHRAVGGGIEFGELAVEALHREFREELDVAIEETELLGVLENRFEFEGTPGHEVVHVFAVRSAALDAVPLDAELVVLDEGSRVRWAPLDTDVPVFPPGVLDVLSECAQSEDLPSAF
ncbi:NUDIX domain-containing protein [Curtobacterium pusillum]|uniref:NUDIX domain-containing protein n=1 Tax=Curtobacterium pusillum TaxID=69373 RepID=UPI00119F0F0A|nr:NUDIX domain-containing protein [Curtobacterium pusillum]